MFCTRYAAKTASYIWLSSIQLKNKDKVMKKHVKKSTVEVLVAAALLMGACAPKEKTITVPELLKDIPLLIKTTAWCKENPGERIALPNCINAAEADTQARFKAAGDRLAHELSPEGQAEFLEKSKGKF
jgi:hypothetical protein